MKHRISLITILLCAVGFTSGCAISKNVQPVQKGTAIQTIFVAHNERVLMKECTNEIVSQLKAMGFDAIRYDGDRPKEAKHYLTYTANWHWDMAMYLTYFRGTIYEDGRVLGEAEYDAKMGGANMKKFGRTAEKLRPLLQEMLRGSDRNRPLAAPMGTPNAASTTD